LRSGFGEVVARHDIAMIVVGRRLTERAPHALERAGIGVEHSDAMIAVTVGYKKLIGRRMLPGIRRAVEIGGIGVTLALIALADLHHDGAVLAELQELIVGHRLQSRKAVARAG